MQRIDEEWLTSQELADRLKVKVCTLDKWAYTGTGPNFIKAGRCRRYPLSHIVEWEQELLKQGMLRRQIAIAIQHQAA
ncbi:helix-turn-helix domain-containing protein [Nocardia uniformis]|uniref:Helix-turn-helix domain-containing protein n=1 Tax=Nocardia uniformis TaxID=53432 RepID=A0A849C7C4_9NOCA|nr:helix-turn-helix domain-containing protein [Nocardia uniformis]NNH73648.1 helix-turn-helix domain-containing protein [Nocardia uniformis]